MRVAWYRARAAFRGRREGLGLALLAGVLVAIALAGVAGSRRTEGAFERMLEAYVQPNAAVFVRDPELAQDPGRAGAVYREASSRIERMPGVHAHGGVATVLIALQDREGQWLPDLAFSSVDRRGYHEIQRPLVIEGRRPDPTAPDEVEVNEAWAEEHGVRVGSEVEIGLVPPNQLDAAGNGFPIELADDAATYEVVGIIRRPGDLAPPLQGVEGTIDEGPEKILYFTAAFWEQRAGEVASYGSGLMVRLADETATDELQSSLEDLNLQVISEGGESGAAIPAIDRAVDIEARALLGATALLGAVAALLLAQAARRQGLDGSAALGAVGMDRRGLALAGATELGAIGALAVVIGVTGAIALSSRAPIGVARRTAPSFGLDADLPVLAIGAVLVLAAFVLGGAVLGWTAPRRLARRGASGRPSRLARWIAAGGFSPGPAIGVRLATEPRGGDRSVAVRSTIVSGVLGVAALTGAIAFSASLDRVVDNPAYRGWNWDLDVGNYSDEATSDEGKRALLANDGVAEVTGWQADFIEINGHEYALVMLDDRDGAPAVGPQVLDGRLPAGEGEIALAHATLEDLDRSVGDEVEAVGPSGEPMTLRIVGETMGVGVIDQTAAIDEGAILTFAGAEPMVPEELGPLYANGFLVRMADGERGQQGVAQLREDFPGTVFGARSTPDIENLRRVQWLPRLLAAGVALLALGTTAHALIGAVRRRRHELALLKCLGLRPRQLLGITVVQATTVGVLALVFGLPLGLAIGRSLWTLAAQEIGTFAGPVVPALPLAVGAVAVLVVAVTLALVPGRSAARTPAAAVLRVE